MVTSRKDSIYIHNFNHHVYDYFMPLDCTPQLLSAMFATGYSTNTSLSTSGFITCFPILPHRLIFSSTGDRYYHPPCYLSQSFRSYPVSTFSYIVFLMTFQTPPKQALNHDQVCHCIINISQTSLFSIPLILIGQ